MQLVETKTPEAPCSFANTRLNKSSDFKSPFLVQLFYRNKLLSSALHIGLAHYYQGELCTWPAPRFRANPLPAMTDNQN
jgi:hypothetical protein